MLLGTSHHDSALGRWTHTEWRPADLAHVVEHGWLFEGRTTHARERTFPGGYLEIIVHLGPRFHAVTEGGATGEPFALVGLTGLQTSPLVVQAPSACCRVLGVRLRPVGAHALLDMPLHEATGRSLDLADVLGAAADELAGRCHDARTPGECFACVDAWVRRRLAGARDVDAGVAWVAAQLERAHGAAAIGGLRERVGTTAARFATAFRAHVGVSPKRYGRILRFRRALDLLHAGGRLADVAHAAGYYDQPHMTAEFNELAGMTPAAFVAASSYPGAPSVAERA